MVKQLTIIFIISLSFAQKGVEPIPKESTWRRSLSRVLGFEDRTYNVHNDGKLALYFSNYGLLGFYNPSLEYPVNTQRYYIWQLGLMIGAKVDTSDNGIDDPVPLVSDTYQDQGEANFNPTAGYHSIGLNPLAAVSNNPVTWPTVWPGDLETGTTGWPGMEQYDYEPVGSQESFWVMRDYESSLFDSHHQTKPGVGCLEVRCRGLQSNTTLTNRIIYFVYDIINKSDRTLLDCRVGLMMDPDHPAHLETEYSDDNAEYIPSLNMAMTYDYDNNYSNWPGVDLAYMGIMMLQTPTTSSGDNIGITSWRSFKYSDMPKSGNIGGSYYASRDEAQYRYMNPGLFSPSPQVKADVCYAMSSGDFNMAPGDTQQIVITIIVANNRDDLLKTAENAVTVYNNNFKTPSAPTPPAVTIIPENEKITLVWEGDQSESSVDKLTGKADFEGYRVYRSTDFGTTWGNPTDDLINYPLEFLPLADYNKFNSITEIGAVEVSHSALVSSASIVNLGIIPDTKSLVDNTYLVTFISDTTFQVYDSRSGWLLALNRGALVDGFSILDSTADWMINPQFVDLEEGITMGPFLPGKILYVGGAAVMIKNGTQDCGITPDLCVQTGDIFKIKTMLIDQGANTGLRHSFVDTNVINGIEYWYAVTAYDRPDPVLGVTMNESTPASQVNTTFAPHTVAGIPRTNTNGVILGNLAADTVYHSAGYGTGKVDIQLLNRNVMDTKDYIIIVHPYGGGYRYSLIENNVSQDTLLGSIAFLNSFTAGANPDFNPVINGFRLILQNDPAGFDSFTQIAGDTNRVLDRIIEIKASERNNQPHYPYRDIAIKFDGTGYIAHQYANRPKDYPTEVPFSVWDVTDKDPTQHYRLHSIYRDVGGSDWNPSQQIWVLDISYDEPFPDQTRSWIQNNVLDVTIRFVGDTEECAANPECAFEYTGWLGDEWLLSTTRSFNDNDRFSFSISGLQESETLELERVKVVPNPFIVNAAWDSQEGQHRVQFTHLPEKCSIKIYTVAGDLVRHLNHEEGSYEWWNLRSSSDMEVAYGVYLYHIEAELKGNKYSTNGKLMVVR